MSSPSETPESSLRFKFILDTALSEYKQTTGNDLLDNWLAKELQSCESVEAILDIITHQAEAFEKFRGGDKRLTKWIDSSVNVLYTISATLGEGVGMALPSAKAVFAGIGVLLAAAKDVRASHDALVDLFQRIQFFLKRLGVHTQISPTNDMVEILVKIVAEVLSILSIATKEMQRCRLGMYLNKLVGRTDIEDALKRLDSLTQEEVRMAIAQILKAMAELKDGAKKAKEAAEQIAINVGELKDNLDETKDNLDGIKDDIDEIKDDVVEIMDDVGEIKGNLDEIKDGVNEVKWDQIEQHIRNWFASPDPSTNYNIACDIHQDGTAAWLFEGGIFKEWELVGSLLWIHGKPGSGKSILSSAIIKHVISLCDAGHASLAYFYFDFRDEDKKNLRKFLTSLLTQLSAYSNPYQDPCREIISHIYSTHGKGTQQPSTGALTKCLHDMLSAAAQQPIYIVIDALDECPDISGFPTPRAVVLDFLEDLVELNVPNLHICVTSRPEADIKLFSSHLHIFLSPFMMKPDKRRTFPTM
ncbi:hypothetical protein EDB84DRAFT_614294 [Lactarius hengduanensis]|nr:hypothetical protein EDB84DRAFT_614294 [Lactarius hengduanensis]